MAGQLKKYAFLNAKLKTRIGKLTPSRTFDALASAKNLPEAIHLLRDTPFSHACDVYERTGDLKSAELELFGREVDLYTEVANYAEDEVKSFVLTLAVRFEIDNLKAVLRCWFERIVKERNISRASGYLYRDRIVHAIPVDDILNADTWEDLIALLSPTPYADVLESIHPPPAESGSLFETENALDREFYRMIFGRIEDLSPRDRQAAERLIGVEIDMRNMNRMIRLVAFNGMAPSKALAYAFPGGFALDAATLERAIDTSGSEGGSTGSGAVDRRVPELLSAMIKSGYPEWSSLLEGDHGDTLSRYLLVERVVGEILNGEVHKALGGYPFSIAVVSAYFILKGNEIAKVITILNAKYYGLSEDRVQEAM
jgi:V/A-type H+/Na+-transporting ATPase subunit C